MRKLVSSILAIILTAAALVAIQSQQATAASYCVQIYRIWYNSPGTDTRRNASLNGEWISLHNRCSTARSLNNWVIRDAARHTFNFGAYRLGGGKYVRVHTGKGTNTATDRYWGQGNYIWNNDKDTAYLRNGPSGTLIDTCSYNNSSSSWVAC